MQHQTIDFANEGEWLDLRRKDVTSTELAALFGVSPYSTYYEVWHQKKGSLEPTFTENDRTRWGNRLEEAIAYGVAEDLGLVVEPFKVYMRIPEERIGSSFDFKVIGLAEDFSGEENEYRDLFRSHGPGIMECKNVDGLAFMRGWDSGDEGIEAPLHIELQMQHQMMASGLQWCVCAPLVAGNTPKPFFRLRDEETIAIARQRIADFWLSQDNDDEPHPDYARDGEAIKSLNLYDDGNTVDMSGNERFLEVCHEYDVARSEEKAAEKRKKTAQAEIMDIIGPAQVALADGVKVSAKTRKGSPGKVVTPDMVGTYIGARRETRYPTVSIKG